MSTAVLLSHFLAFFFFPGTAPTEIYTLSLHDALPICGELPRLQLSDRLLHVFLLSEGVIDVRETHVVAGLDRKSTRLNSSHGYISYAVFCLKKKKMKATCADCTHRLPCVCSTYV